MVEKNGSAVLDHNRPQSIGRVRAFYGNFGVLVRALAYILANGPGIRQATEDAVLNANYIRKKLEDVYELPYASPSLHEVRLQRRAPEEIRREHHGHRQAPDRLRLPSLHHGIPADRPRRADDRADRIRIARKSATSSSTPCARSPKKPPRNPIW